MEKQRVPVYGFDGGNLIGWFLLEHGDDYEVIQLDEGRHFIRGGGSMSDAWYDEISVQHLTYGQFEQNFEQNK